MNKQVPRRPTKQELAEAKDRVIHDVARRGLDVIFCGINPGLYSAATGWHFARPGNRFWPVLHRSGFTDRLLHPSEQARLLRYGLGVTNIVARASASAAELQERELREGAAALKAKVERWGPRYLAILGIGAYRVAFSSRGATLGPQPTQVGYTEIWVLPNPSGLNAHYQIADLVQLFTDLKKTARR